MRRATLTLALLLLSGAPALAQNVDWAAPAAPEGAAEDVQEAEDETGESRKGVIIDEVGMAPPLPPPPAPVPLDGGLTLLGAAGAAYAVNRLRRRRAGA